MRWKIVEYVKQPSFFVYFICAKNMSLSFLIKMSTNSDELEVETWRTWSFNKNLKNYFAFGLLNTSIGTVNHNIKYIFKSLS